MTLSLSGCVAAGPANDFCLIAQPIYIAPEDQVTGQTARALLTHNEIWAEICNPHNNKDY